MNTKLTLYGMPVLYVLLAALVAIGTNVLAADGPVSATLEGPPSGWLSGTGKSDEWKATTLHCRELLQKLNLPQTLVQKHLPTVKGKVQLLWRSPDFDWKKKTAVDYQPDAGERRPNRCCCYRVLSAAELRAPNGQVWPDEANKAERGYYAGYHRSVGEYRQPPIHEDAALLLFSGTMPKTTKLIAPNAGYNFGLAGLSAPLTIRAGQKLLLPLLLVRRLQFGESVGGSRAQFFSFVPCVARCFRMGGFLAGVIDPVITRTSPSV